MKSVTKGNIKIAVAAVRSTKWRSFFTMLGIIIGVVSVMMIVGIGEGIKQQVHEQINRLGKDLITVRPRELGAGQPHIQLISTPAASGALSPTDLLNVQRSQGVRLAVPMSIVGGEVKAEKATTENSLVIGTTPSLPDVLNQSLAYGQFFTMANEGTNVAVIGQNVARQLFDVNVPLGRSFEFRGQQFVVEGIFNEFDAAPLSLDTDYNSAIFIPDQTAQALTDNNAPIYEILARPSDPRQAGAVVASIDRNLAKAHGGQQDFTVQQQSQSLEATNSILDLMTRLVAGVAAISLLVGGIGIMNIMLVSVTERMHEIGIRKAVGATNRQILNQFVVESSVLCVLGGLIGVIIAFIVDIFLRLFTNFQPIISWWLVLLAVGVSLVVGMIFGAVPALKAARKDPIEALRND